MEIPVEEVREKGAPLHRTQGFKTYRPSEIAVHEALTGLVHTSWLEIDLWTKVPVLTRPR